MRVLEEGKLTLQDVDSGGRAGAVPEDQDGLSGGQVAHRAVHHFADGHATAQGVRSGCATVLFAYGDRVGANRDNHSAVASLLDAVLKGFGTRPGVVGGLRCPHRVMRNVSSVGSMGGMGGGYGECLRGCGAGRYVYIDVRTNHQISRAAGNHTQDVRAGRIGNTYVSALRLHVQRLITGGGQHSAHRRLVGVYSRRRRALCLDIRRPHTDGQRQDNACYACG